MSEEIEEPSVRECLEWLWHRQVGVLTYKISLVHEYILHSVVATFALIVIILVFKLQATTLIKLYIYD